MLQNTSNEVSALCFVHQLGAHNAFIMAKIEAQKRQARRAKVL